MNSKKAPYSQKAGRLTKPTPHQASPRNVHILLPSEEASIHLLVSKELSFLKTPISAPALVFRRVPDVTCEHSWARAQTLQTQGLTPDGSTPPQGPLTLGKGLESPELTTKLISQIIGKWSPWRGPCAHFLFLRDKLPQLDGFKQHPLTGSQFCR